MKKKYITNDEAAYDKLPVIYWNEILQTGKNHASAAYATRRPARMHNTLNLHAAAWWIESCFGIPMDKIEFVGVDVNDWENKTVKDLQPKDTTNE